MYFLKKAPFKNDIYLIFIDILQYYFFVNLQLYKYIKKNFVFELSK